MGSLDQKNNKIATCPTKKKLAIGLATVFCLLLIAIIGVYVLFSTQIKAIRTITELQAGLYFLEYQGDYGFSDFLKKGGADSSEAVAAYLTEFFSRGFYKHSVKEEGFGCSSIAAQTVDSQRLFGRNFDWEDCTTMIVKTIPKDGYASISTVNLGFLGFGRDFIPKSLMEKMLLLAATFVPLDGMNEKGLCVADLMIDYPQETHQNTGKPGLTTTTAIRLILDQASNIAEAVALLKQYDMHSDAGLMHHLALADAEGHSVVIEYLDNQMVVTDTNIVTNFFLTEGEWYGLGSESSKSRYEILNENYISKGGVLSPEQIRDVLSKVAQSNFEQDFDKTVWSIVYNQTEKNLTFYLREQFKNPIFFAL